MAMGLDLLVHLEPRAELLLDISQSQSDRFCWEWIELFNSDNCSRGFIEFLALSNQVVINLSGAENQSISLCNFCICNDWLEMARSEIV